MKFNKKIFVKKFLSIIAVASILMCSTVSASAVSIQSYIPDCNLGAIGTPYASVAVSFPLASYPEGSYYSTTGSACSCHNWCSWSSSCTCKKYDSSSQCAAFAKYIFYTAKGYHYSDGTTKTKNISLTSSTAKNALKGLSTGTYIRVKTSGNWQHSLAIVSTSDTHITVYHANYGGACKVRYQTYTWEDFATAFTYLYYYVY